MTTTTTSQYTWSKGKNGDWLVRGPVTDDGHVTVTKKSGETQRVALARQVWTDGSIALYAPERQTTAASTAHGSYRTIGARMAARKRAGWSGCRCGSIEGQPRKSDCADCRHDY